MNIDRHTFVERSILLKVSNTLLVKYKCVSPHSGISSVAVMDCILEILLTLELFAEPDDNSAYIDML